MQTFRHFIRCPTRAASTQHSLHTITRSYPPPILAGPPDFVSAPPSPRSRRTRGSLLAGGSTGTGSSSGSTAGELQGRAGGEEDKVSSADTGTSRVQT
jgi:hypothetical protein